MKHAAMILFALAALGASACGKKDEPKPTPTAASGSAPVGSAATGSAGEGSAAAGSAAAGSAAAGSAAPATAEVEVPTEVDFETDAAAKIDEKNVEAQLKAIEQELAR